MFQIKPISKESIPSALEKAERYRLLNEPVLAESICLDILRADPSHKRAIIVMVLAITDQFSTGFTTDTVEQAQEFVSKLSDEYERFYYSGLIMERQGNAVLNGTGQENSFLAYELLKSAMENYEKAEVIRPPGKDDAILRWNTCARLIIRHRLEVVVDSE